MKEKRRSSEFNSKAKQSCVVSWRALDSQPLTLRNLPVHYTEQGLLFHIHSQLEQRVSQSRKHKSYPMSDKREMVNRNRWQCFCCYYIKDSVKCILFISILILCLGPSPSTIRISMKLVRMSIQTEYVNIHYY